MAEGRDLLAIEGLEVETRIGVHPFERRSLRRLSLDLEFPCAAQSAAARDELAEALDYDGVAEAVRAFAAGATYRLVESFAEGLAAELLARFPMDWIRITLRKPGAVPGARGCGFASSAAGGRRMAARAEADPGRLLVLLGSNRQPALHLGLALEALDRIAPVLAELGRTVAPAVGGPGRYENRLVLCRAPPGPPAAVDRRLKALERRLAPRRGERDCPLDLDPFLLLREGRAEAFARTPKVLALLSRLDPVGRLGLDPVLRAGPPLE